MASRLLVLPPDVPHTNSRFAPHFAHFVLWLGGWRMQGEFANLRHAVMIAAPHSSGWDAVWGIAAKVAIRLEICFMAKAELFRGPLGWFLRALGAMPIDRSSAQGSVAQAVDRMNNSETMWFLVAPEGTRRHVSKWKTGFWHAARGANVPVICAAFDYPTRMITISPPFEMTSDCDADIARLREWYRPFRGKNRNTC